MSTDKIEYSIAFIDLKNKNAELIHVFIKKIYFLSIVLK